jgi:hypothetical protein
MVSAHGPSSIFVNSSTISSLGKRMNVALLGDPQIGPFHKNGDKSRSGRFKKELGCLREHFLVNRLFPELSQT